MKDENEKYSGGLWDDRIFDSDSNDNEENIGMVPKEHDDHACRKYGRKISALGKGWHVELCDDCFNEELAGE